MSPTARTKQHLEGLDAHVESVEKIIPGTYIKKDLFGCADLCVILGKQLVMIQCTDATSHGKRVTKAMQSEGLRRYLMTGNGENTFEVWSWSQPEGPRTPWKARVTQLRVNERTEKIVIV